MLPYFNECHFFPFGSCTIGFVLTLGLAFSISTRCLVLLTLPQMFSKQGRSFLLVYATVLVFTYPVSNFNRNLMVVADSATCGQSLMLNETQRLLQMVKDPLSAVIDSLEEMFDRIKRFADLLQGAFKALARAVKEIASAIAKVGVQSCLITIVRVYLSVSGLRYFTEKYLRKFFFLSRFSSGFTILWTFATSRWGSHTKSVQRFLMMLTKIAADVWGSLTLSVESSPPLLTFATSPASENYCACCRLQ